MATVRGNLTAWDPFYKTVAGSSCGGFNCSALLCKFCLERGIVTAARVVDHVTRHRGD